MIDIDFGQWNGQAVKPDQTHKTWNLEHAQSILQRDTNENVPRKQGQLDPMTAVVPAMNGFV
jgi:hypothetical protein